MAALERTKSGQFSLESAVTLAELEEKLKMAGESREEVLDTLVIPVDQMFADCPKLRLVSQWERLVRNGNSFEEKNLGQEYRKEDRADKGQYRVYIGDDVFMGIYEYHKAEKRFSPVKMFINQ